MNPFFHHCLVPRYFFFFFSTSSRSNIFTCQTIIKQKGITILYVPIPERKDPQIHTFPDESNEPRESFYFFFEMRPIATRDVIRKSNLSVLGTSVYDKR